MAHTLRQPAAALADAALSTAAAVLAGGGFLRRFLAGVAAHELFGWAQQKVERRTVYRRALARARASGKPLLIVGAPDGEYGCGNPALGDVVLDLRVDRQCPNQVQGNVEDLSRWRDGHFSAAFVSFTLQQVCDPARALRELHRVAAEVYLVEADPARIASYFVPGRTWVMVRSGSGGARFVRLPGRTRCNVGSRYGAGPGG